MEGERDALESAIRRSEQERSRLNRQKQLMEDERHLLGHEKEVLKEERVRWKKAHEEIESERDALDRQKQLMEDERHLLEHEKGALREERERWDKAREEMEGERDALESAIRRSEQERSRFDRQKQLMEEERHSLEHEEEALREERERWEKTREDRVPQGAFWEVVWPAWDCRAYGKREYWGMLQNIPDDWTDLDACMNMPVEIKGVSVRRPDRCAYVAGSPHIHGFWIVDWDQPDCQPWHKDFNDRVRRGKLWRHPHVRLGSRSSISRVARTRDLVPVASKPG